MWGGGGAECFTKTNRFEILKIYEKVKLMFLFFELLELAVLEILKRRFDERNRYFKEINVYF